MRGIVKRKQFARRKHSDKYAGLSQLMEGLMQTREDLKMPAKEIEVRKKTDKG